MLDVVTYFFFFFLNPCYFGRWQKTREVYGKEPWECEEEELAEILVSTGPAIQHVHGVPRVGAGVSLQSMTLPTQTRDQY